MNKGIKSLFGLITKMSITAKFAVMMGGFMTILSTATIATFWTANMQKGDAKVINIAGRQRMLSQKMTKEAMALIQGKEKKEDVLKTADLFDKSLSDLISGNPGEGIPSTKEPHISAQLLKVQALWKEFNFNLRGLVDISDEREEVYDNINKMNVSLLDEMNKAVSMMEEEKLDARTINLAGRQRMLSQKMTKEALGLESGRAAPEELLETVSLFDRTLGGLINGDASLGLGKMKNATILSQLRKVEGIWDDFKFNIERLASLSEKSRKFTHSILEKNIPLLDAMNIAVGQYENASTGKVSYLKLIQLVLLVVTLLFFGIGWFFVTNPIVQSFTTVAEDLSYRSQDIEGVTKELNEGARAQATIVQSATKDLENMIINIIQGSITLSVEKQTEMSRVFSEFLKQFVERTSAEIAMGIMSVAQQAGEARKGVADFVAELETVEHNIKDQESAIGEMVEALKSIVEANEDVKAKVRSSAEAADKATSKSASGRERIGQITEQLREIGNASEGVRDITDSLATITESIKILALNMSLKVEDIKDDTGKSYGFEAMSAKVQQLAEEVEELLSKSKDMIMPTIEAIERVSNDAAQANDLIAEVASAIKAADDESKAIEEKIRKQASDVDRIEVEAENLRALAHKTTVAIEAQGVLAKDVDKMLNDSAALIDSVSKQTEDSVAGARKVSDLMNQLRETVVSIEAGTGKLAEKSTQISDMFSSIMDLARRNRGEAEKLGSVTTSVRDVSRRLSEVVKGA